MILFVFALTSTSLYAQATCDEDAYYESLSQSESGGCEDQYSCLGPTITSGMHAGDEPLGKYQFMPKTLESMGYTQSQIASFRSTPALQEQAIRDFTAANDACLERTGAYDHIGETRVDSSGNTFVVTRSGLLGAAHLGGCGGATNWVTGTTGAASDQLGTSVADYASKFGGYGMFGDVPGGTCGAGVSNAADLFAESQAQGLHDLIGCDPEYFEQAEAIFDAKQAHEQMMIQQTIAPPTNIIATSCAEQHAAMMGNDIGKIFSEPANGITEMSTIVEASIMGTINEALSTLAGDVLGSMFSNIVNDSIGDTLGGMVGGGSGGVASASDGCTLPQEMFELQKCMQMPEFPSFHEALNQVASGAAGFAADAINEKIGGAVNDIEQVVNAINDPLGMAVKSCEALSDRLGEFAADPGSAFVRAAFD